MISILCQICVLSKLSSTKAGNGDAHISYKELI